MTALWLAPGAAWIDRRETAVRAKQQYVHNNSTCATKSRKESVTHRGADGSYLDGSRDC